jgi:hypothetical protein
MQRKLSTKLALTATLTVGLFAMSASSALAGASGGEGAFNAAAHVNPPPEVCATYSLYNAQMVFASDNSVVTVQSDPNPNSPYYQWGENGDGTFNPQTSLQASTPCTDGPGAPKGVEDGFTGTLTIPDGDQSTVCALSDGSYSRTGIDITYDFDTVQGAGCPPSQTIEARLRVLQHFDPPLMIGPFEITDLAACNSIIAPTSCVLEEGSRTP